MCNFFDLFAIFVVEARWGISAMILSEHSFNHPHLLIFYFCLFCCFLSLVIFCTSFWWIKDVRLFDVRMRYTRTCRFAVVFRLMMTGACWRWIFIVREVRVDVGDVMWVGRLDDGSAHLSLADDVIVVVARRVTVAVHLVVTDRPRHSRLLAAPSKPAVFEHRPV